MFDNEIKLFFINNNLFKDRVRKNLFKGINLINNSNVVMLLQSKTHLGWSMI
jgi:hypothetical protein